MAEMRWPGCDQITLFSIRRNLGRQCCPYGVLLRIIMLNPIFLIEVTTERNKKKGLIKPLFLAELLYLAKHFPILLWLLHPSVLLSPLYLVNTEGCIYHGGYLGRYSNSLSGQLQCGLS